VHEPRDRRRGWFPPHQDTDTRGKIASAKYESAGGPRDARTIIEPAIDQNAVAPFGVPRPVGPS
jgi:hypothetical protein